MSSGISTTKGQAGHGAPFLSFSTVFNNYFLPDDLTDQMDTTQREQATYSIKAGDVFLTRTSETLDELGMSSVAVKDYPHATFSGFLKRLRPLPNNGVYSKYLAFYLRSSYFRKTMNNNAVMTLRSSLNEDIFSYLKLYLPSYENQVTIGNLLFSVEKKIQFNKKLMAELEATARLIYDYWFTQFDFPDEDGKPYRSNGGKMVWSDELKREIPACWSAGKTGDLIEGVRTGLNPRTNFTLKSSGIAYLTVKNLTSSGAIDFTGCDFIDEADRAIVHKRSDVSKGDILFASIAPLGRCHLVREDPNEWDINESVFSVRPNLATTTPEFMYMLLTGNWFKKAAEGSSAGSVFKGIRNEELRALAMPIPDIKTMQDFSHRIAPIMEETGRLQKESHELQGLRDWLLPMLMNGQAQVID